MIITLAVNAVAQGLMVVHMGGFSPQDSSSQAMRTLATGDLVFGLPNALIVWAVVGAGAVFVLRRTTFGRAVYGTAITSARLSVGRRHPADRSHPLCGRRRPLGFRWRPARWLRQQGGAGHGRRLFSAGDRLGGAWRRFDPWRSRQLFRHGSRRHPPHPAAIDPFGRADAGGRTPDHLRCGHRRDAVARWAGGGAAAPICRCGVLG